MELGVAFGDLTVVGERRKQFKMSARNANFDGFGKTFSLSRQNTYATANMHKSEITHFLLGC